MDDEETRVERIAVLLDLGRYADAATAARAGLSCEPDSGALHHVLARALIGLDDVPGALQHARAAAAADPESPEALALLSGTLAEVGAGRDARDAAIRTIHLAPHAWQSHVTYAHALLFGIGGRQTLPEAEAAARRAIELGPHEPAAHVAFGIVRWRQDDVATAELAFRHALSLDTDDLDAQRNLASLQISERDLWTGSATLTRGLSSHPQDRGMHAEADRARRQVLTSTSFWFLTVAFVLGGFMLATEFTWRERAGTPAIALVLLAAGGVRRAVVLPGSTASLLPWSAPAGQRWPTTMEWTSIALASSVFLLPGGAAGKAWAAVVAVLAWRTAIFWLRVMRADSAAHRSPDAEH